MSRIDRQRSHFTRFLAKYVLVATLAGYGLASSASAQPCIGCMQFIVGPPTILTGPENAYIADSNLIAFESGPNEITAYSANTATSRLVGPSIGTLKVADLGTILKGSSPPGFDSCDAAVFSVLPEYGKVVALYHAETDCDYDNGGQTHKSMAVATSSDSGKSFSKGPQVLTSSEPPAIGRPSGVGDGSFLRWGQYTYLYYLDWAQGPTAGWTAVARSPAGAETDPSQWRKYYTGSFSQPGLLGQNTILGNLGSAVSLNTYWNILMLPNWGSIQRGLALKFSTDGLDWSLQLGEPLLRVMNQVWGQQTLSTQVADSHEFLAYISLVAVNGGRAWCDVFYLTYSYIPPGTDMQTRYIVVRRVGVKYVAAPSIPQVRVTLTRYWSQQREAHWTTTAAPTVDPPLLTGPNDFRREFDLGYTLTKDYGGMVELFDCFIPEWGKTMIGPGFCADGNYVLRSLGYIYANQKPNTIPLYRCFWAEKNDHWVFTAPCEQYGSRTDFLRHARLRSHIRIGKGGLWKKF